MEKIYLHQNDHIEVRLTPDKGYCVFATKDIEKDSLIEKCYCIKVTDLFKDVPFALKDYTFNYPRGLNGKSGETIQVLPLGYGCIYNHDESPNARWENAKEEMYFDFISIENIKKGEEICTYYGHQYWKSYKKRRDEMV